MHKKSADKFNAGDGKLFPFSLFTVVFDVVGNRIFVHADDTVVADGNPVCVFSKVVNNGLRTVEGFLAVGNPVLVITKVEQFFENITIVVLSTASMKLKLFRFIKGFEFSHVFATEQL